VAPPPHPQTPNPQSPIPNLFFIIFLDIKIKENKIK